MGNETLVKTDSGHRTSRLSVKPAGSPAGFVNGAWWPPTADLAVELPDLLAALAGRLGLAERVTRDAGTMRLPHLIYGGCTTHQIRQDLVARGLGSLAITSVYPPGTALPGDDS